MNRSFFDYVFSIQLHYNTIHSESPSIVETFKIFPSNTFHTNIEFVSSHSLIFRNVLQMKPKSDKNTNDLQFDKNYYCLAAPQFRSSNL